MPASVAGIHVFLCATSASKAWMGGTSPATTPRKLLRKGPGRSRLLRRRPDRHRANRRTGISLRAQRQDHGARHPDLVVGECPEVGVLDLVDAGLGEIVVVDRKRQGRRRAGGRARLALKGAVRHRIGEWI